MRFCALSEMNIRDSNKNNMSHIEQSIAHAAEDFISLRGSSIFITGGTGYVGRLLLESLCLANKKWNLNLRLTVLSRNPRNFLNAHPYYEKDDFINFVCGDIRSFKFPIKHFDYVIHGAADIVAKNSPIDVFDVNVNGTKHALDFAANCGAKNFLLLSSGAVYGKAEFNNYPIAESESISLDIKSPVGAYGLGKASAEWLANLYSENYGFSCKIARIFAQIGPGLELDSHFAAGNFIRDALQGREILINGDGAAVRSYMYSTDLVNWLLRILIRGESGVAYNVASEEGITITGLANKILAYVNGLSPGIRILGMHTTSSASDTYVPSTKLARSKLGLNLYIGLDEAISRTVDWYRPRIGLT